MRSIFPGPSAGHEVKSAGHEVNPAGREVNPAGCAHLTSNPAGPTSNPAGPTSNPAGVQEKLTSIIFIFYSGLCPEHNGVRRGSPPE